MIAFVQAQTQAARLNQVLNLTSFSVALWFRTSSTTNQTFMGASDELMDKFLLAQFNAPAANNLSISLKKAGATRTQWYNLAAAYDGKPHLLVIVRDGALAQFKAYFDGALLTLAGGSGLVSAGGAINPGVPFMIGSFNQGGSPNGYADLDAGEWSFFDRVLGTDEISALAAGTPARMLSPMPLEYWEGFDEQIILPAGTVYFFGSPAPSAANMHPPICYPSGLVDGGVHVGFEGGYDLYSKSGAIPDPLSDVPFARVDRNTTMVQFAESQFGLVPLTTHFFAVAALNLSGRSSVSFFSFPVDASGHLLSVPQIVSGLTVRALAGGRLRIGWDYDEFFSFAVANEFRVTLESLAGLAAPAAITVPHVSPQRSYSIEAGPFADGPWRVRVYSVRAGQWQPAVTGVDCRTDSTPPVGSVVGLTAF